MRQTDYILRMIEMMAVIVREIRQMILGGDSAKAEAQMQDVAARTGLDLAVGRAMDGESLLALFMPPGSTVDPTNCMLFGEVLYLDGLLARREGRQEEARASFAKAQLLLRAGTAERVAAGVQYPQVRDRLAELETLLAESPPESAA